MYVCMYIYIHGKQSPFLPALGDGSGDSWCRPSLPHRKPPGGLRRAPTTGVPQKGVGLGWGGATTSKPVASMSCKTWGLKETIPTSFITSLPGFQIQPMAPNRIDGMDDQPLLAGWRHMTSFFFFEPCHCKTTHDMCLQKLVRFALLNSNRTKTR